MKVHRSSLMLLAALLTAAWSHRASDEEAPPAWELWPYRVQLIVAIDDGPLLPGRMREELSGQIQSRIAAAMRGAWQLDVIAAEGDQQQSILDNIAKFPFESLVDTEKLDKVILLAVASHDGRLTACAREHDLATGLSNATISIASPQPEYLPHAAVRAVLSAFAPLARIESSDGQTATIKLRASGLVPQGNRLLPAGDAVFRPVLLPCDSNGAFSRGKGELIDWTYLTAKDAGGGTLECRVETALAGQVIPEYHPLRQRWALGVSRSSNSTRLRLVSRGSDAEPIEGITIVAEEDPPVVIGQSDRRGEVIVSPEGRTVRTIAIRQGDEVLARLLLVPGLQAELIVPVDYDRRLVELEAVLAQLSDDVVDAAARRALQRQPAASSIDSLLTRLDRLTQAVQSATPGTRRRLEPKLAELRKGIEQLR